MSRIWLILLPLIAILVMVPLTACDDDDEDQTSPSTAESKDDLRIISLAPGNTEILFALGLNDQVVGVTEYCDYPAEAQEKAKIGGYNTVDMEKVIGSNPDLVLAANIHKETIVPELERRGINVVTLDPGTIAEVLEGITLVGTLTGTEEEASQLVDQMQSRINAVANTVRAWLEADSETAGAKEEPGVFYMTWHDPIWTLGKGTMTHELITTSGGRNIFEEASGHMETDLENLISRNPDVILASTGHGAAEDSPLYWAQTEERLMHTPAVQNSRVYEVNADLVTRPGPRLVDGLELIAQLIHPDLFPATD